MEVLEWLEGTTFEWDMYVDLPENSVRYCFRTLADACAFKQQFGHAPEGRTVAIYREWPHQVVLPARFCERGGYKEIHDSAKVCRCVVEATPFSMANGSTCTASRSMDDAEKFKKRFGGEKFDPSQRGKGRNWARWNKR